MKLLIIGCGSIGFRHAQAAVASGVLKKLFLFDSQPQSYTKFFENFSAKIELESCENIHKLPSNVDIIIFATTADQRAAIVYKVFETTECTAMIIEKPLSQEISGYDIYSKLEDVFSGAYVNCPRQLYPVYGTLKKKVEAGFDLNLAEISGKNWGLACNGIHFIVLFDYLLGGIDINDIYGKELEWIDAKRQGYIECLGTIEIIFDGGKKLILNSDTHSKFSQNYMSSKFKFVVDEEIGLFNQDRLIFEKKIPTIKRNNDKRVC